MKKFRTYIFSLLLLGIFLVLGSCFEKKVQDVSSEISSGAQIENIIDISQQQGDSIPQDIEFEEDLDVLQQDVETSNIILNASGTTSSEDIKEHQEIIQKTEEDLEELFNSFYDTSVQ